MQPLPSRWDPPAVEAAARALWTARGLLDATGPFGPEAGPVTHQLLGTVFPFDSEASVRHRLLLADAFARLEALSGNRTLTSVEFGQDRPGAEPRQLEPGALGPPLRFRLGSPSPDGDRASQPLVDRLAVSGVLVGRTAPLRTCVSCGITPSPETIVYENETGEAYVVRFPVRGDPRGARLLVWTDAAWKLLGTSAVLVNPESPYATVRFRRRGQEETIVVAREALGRLLAWAPGAEVEVIDERPGRAWGGVLYDHPLAAGYPLLADLPPPAGGIVPFQGVHTDRTGLVTLTPAHGFIDSQVAQEVQLPGWPVVTADGRVDSSLRHNYVGLSLADAEAFAMRDLVDSGALFARIPARRGVPHCAACGSELIWITGRTWTFEPGRLAPETRERAARLLGPSPVAPVGVGIPWPVASSSSLDPEAEVALLECSSCERLAPAPGAELCTCGGSRTQVRRRLVPGFREALAAALRQRPFADGDRLRLLLPERRRDAAVWHLLAALEAAGQVPGDVRLASYPGLPDLDPTAAAPEPAPLDSMRLATLSRLSASPRLGVSPAEVRRRSRILRRLWSISGEVVRVGIAAGYSPDGPAPTGRGDELWLEDRAFLATFEGLRTEVARAYALDEVGEAARRICDYLEHELPAAWRILLAYRLRGAGLPPSKASALRVLSYVLPTLAQLVAPLAPFSAEGIARAFRRDPGSVFQGRLAPLPDDSRNPVAEEQFDRWVGLGEAIARARDRWRIAPDEPLPALTLQIEDSARAGKLRGELEVVRRLARSAKVEVVESPGATLEPTFRVVPNLPEIQRAYGAPAPRLTRVLAGMAGKRVREGLKAENLSIVLDGRPFPISASMVEVAATLPSGWVVEPAPGGSLLIELPRSSTSPPPANPPVLSSDGYRVVERVSRRLRRASLAPDDLARLYLSGPLLGELAGEAPRLAAELAIPRFEISPFPDRGVPGARAHGRTRRGDRWALVLSGRAAPPHRSTKARAPSRQPRFVRRLPVNPAPEDVPYLTDETIAQYGQIREIGEQLEEALGAKVVGPTKLSHAWDAGLQTYEAFEHAPFELLAPIPGFGRQLAESIVGHFGGAVPVRAPRMRPVLDQPSESPTDPTPADPSPLAVPLAPEPPRAEAAGPAVPEPRPLPPALVETLPAPVSRFPEWKPRAAPEPPPKPVEPVVPVPAVSPPSSGGLDLVVGGSDAAWDRFLDAGAAGHRGLCISREVPDRVRARLGPRNVEVLWLSNAARENSVRPTDLGAIETAVVGAVEGRGVTIVYLAGLEYLLFLHPAEAITGLLRSLDELGRSKGVRLWAPVEPGLTDAAKLTAVQTGFQSPVGNA